MFPQSIYYHYDFEKTFFVGDYHTVQLFTEDGTLIQRFEDWKNRKNRTNQLKHFYGFCILNDQLYVADHSNNPIQIFNKNSGN